jgi:hypothetical protein
MAVATSMDETLSMSSVRGGLAVAGLRQFLHQVVDQPWSPKTMLLPSCRPCRRCWRRR